MTGADWAFFVISLACCTLFAWCGWFVIQVVKAWWTDRRGDF